MLGSVNRAKNCLYACATAMLLLVAACGSKDHPPTLMDEVVSSPDSGSVVSHPKGDASASKDGASKDGAGLDGAGVDGAQGVDPNDGGAIDGGAFDPLAANLHTACTETPPFDALFCFATEKDHPAAASTPPDKLRLTLDIRNAGVVFQFKVDDAHRQFDSVMSVQGRVWKLTVIAPTGQELKPGSYSTESNDGASLSFAWDVGACPGVESATFDIYNLTWDDKNIPTHAEIDFRHHCGDLNAPALRAEYRLFSTRP